MDYFKEVQVNYVIVKNGNRSLLIACSTQESVMMGTVNDILLFCLKNNITKFTIR